MRITRVHIKSFGTTRDRTYRFSQGLNVVYGPNESGKSTLKSFVTGTLFPDKVPSYPESSASDSGEVEVACETGETIVVTRKGRKSDSTAAERCGVTGAEYRSVFSLDTDDLRDMDLLEKGGLRGRLIALPGSAVVPAVSDAIASEKTRLIPESKRSKTCSVSVLRTELEKAQSDVKALQDSVGDTGYTELVSREMVLEKELEGAKAEEERLFNAYSEAARADGLRENREKAEALKEERKTLVYAEKADEKAFGSYNELHTRRKIAEEEATAARRSAEEKNAAMNGRDPEKITALSDRISRFNTMYERCSAAGTAEASTTRNKTGVPVLAAIGALIAVAGVAVMVAVNLIGGLVLTAAGVLAILIGVRRRGEIAQPARDDAEKKAMEREWHELCAASGLTPSEPGRDCVILGQLLTKAREAVDAKRRMSDKERNMEVAQEALDNFLSGFGGEDGFIRARQDNEKLKGINAALESLGDSGDSRAEIPVQSDGAAKVAYDAAKAHRSELDSELAEVRAKKNAVLKDGTVDDAMNHQADALSRYTAAVRRWIVLALEAKILDDSCDGLLERNTPAAYSVADRLLRLMTAGRYTVSADPRDSSLTVCEIQSGVRKTTKQLSSGTEDQVKLAMKLGVALSLPKEKPPVILDDVLLTSDDERLKGCCDALAQFSGSAQVIFFTCDRRTMEALSTAGAEVVLM